MHKVVTLSTQLSFLVYIIEFYLMCIKGEKSAKSAFCALAWVSAQNADLTNFQSFL